MSDPGRIGRRGGALSGAHLLIKGLGAAFETPASYLGPPSHLAVGPIRVRGFFSFVFQVGLSSSDWIECSWPTGRERDSKQRRGLAELVGRQCWVRWALRSGVYLAEDRSQWCWQGMDTG